MLYFGNKMDVVGFATALQLRFGKDSQLTTITRVGKSEDYSVSVVTNSSSEDIVKELAATYFLRPTLTLPVNIRAGLSRIK